MIDSLRILIDPETTKEDLMRRGHLLRRPSDDSPPQEGHRQMVIRRGSNEAQAVPLAARASASTARIALKAVIGSL